MSHITTENLEIPITSEQGLISVLKEMCKEFTGMTFTQENPDKIQVRYAPIETYSRWKNTGNMRFIRQADGTWQMQGDGYNCHDAYNEVKNSFLKYHTANHAAAAMQQMGYMLTYQTVGKNKVLVARKY